MKDFYNNLRGKCLHDECSTRETECPEFYILDYSVSLACNYCGHFARNHAFITATGDNNFLFRPFTGIVHPDHRLKPSLLYNSGNSRHKKKKHRQASLETHRRHHVSSVQSSENSSAKSESKKRLRLQTPNTQTEQCVAWTSNSDLMKNLAAKKVKQEIESSLSEEAFLESHFLGFGEEANGFEFVTTKQDVHEGNRDGDHVDSSGCLSGQNQIKYIPDKFSDYVMPLLMGEDLPPDKEKALKKQLIREMQFYLDDNDLIASSDPTQNKKEYCILGDQLSKMYKKFQWTNLSSRNNHVCQGMIATLGSRRRQTRYYKRAKEAGRCEGVDQTAEQALETLEELMEQEEFEAKDVCDLLTLSFPLRRDSTFLGIPFYLQIKQTIMCEIGLKLGQECSGLVRGLKVLVKMFQEVEKKENATLYDVESYFKGHSSNSDRFLTLASDPPSNVNPKRPGPCVVFIEDKNDCFLYSCQDDEFVSISGHFSMEEAVLVGLGSYFLVGRSYPMAFGQFLGLIEIYLNITRNPFPISLRTKRLQGLLSLMIDPVK